MLLACMASLGPFSIDTYLPAFEGMAHSLRATPAQMQQTLAVYLMGLALMNLFHGALADALGRKPVIVVSTAVFTLASVGCALSQSIESLIAFRLLQGLASGAGGVVARAVIRDLFDQAQAQRLMSQMTMFFGVAPAVAPLIGGVLDAQLGWRSIFWFLALVGLALVMLTLRALPETLPPAQRQPLGLRNLLRGYSTLGRNLRFVLVCVATGVSFNGMFIYVLAAPVYLGQHLQWPTTQFFWFFVLNILGIVTGAWWSGRMAGPVSAHEQIKRGLLIMVAMSTLNVVLSWASSAGWALNPRWTMLPITVYALGWSVINPVLTLLALDVVPNRRGMAASLQAFIALSSSGLVAGLVVPWVMGSMLHLALAAAATGWVGTLAWLLVRPTLNPAKPITNF
jgi:MFS transporter, DHA1 family, multidrug resistance protein